jgi:hypothetical protein
VTPLLGVDSLSDLSTFQIIFGLLTSLGGLAGLAALYSAILQKSKINAEAKRIGVDSDMVMSDKALEMYRMARNEAQEAKNDARNCQIMLRAVMVHVDDLERQMRNAGMRPAKFKPPIVGEEPAQ